eukprot:COSAG01_NODE_8849_length_2638_cov_1.501772_2_plen_317_part_00
MLLTLLTTSLVPVAGRVVFEPPVLVGSSQNASTHFWFPESFAVLADGTLLGPVRTTDDGPVSEPHPYKPFLPGCLAGTGGGTGCVAIRLSTDAGRSWGWMSNDTSTFPSSLRHGVGDHKWGGHIVEGHAEEGHAEITPRMMAGQQQRFVMTNSAETLGYNSTCSPHDPWVPCNGTRCVRMSNPGLVRRVSGTNRLVWSPAPHNLSFCGLPWHTGCGNGRTAGNDTRGCAADLFRSLSNAVAMDPRTHRLYLAVSPLSDVSAHGGDSGLGVVTSMDGLAWTWLAWVAQPHQIDRRFRYEQFAVGEPGVSILEAVHIG